MIGFRSRSARVGVVAALVVSSVLTGFVVRPAAANSAQGLAANSWLISDLASEAMTAIPQSAEVSAYERSLATSATVGTAAASGVRTVPKPGVLGMVINTVGVLGGLAFAFGGDDDPAMPEIPLPPSTEGATGSESVGWTNVPGATIVPVSGSSAVRVRVPVGGSVTRWYRRTVAMDGTAPGTWSLACFDTSGCTTNGISISTGPSPSRTQLIGTGGSAPSAGAVPSGDVWLPAAGGTMPNPQPGASADPSVVPRYIDSQITCKSASGASQTITRTDGPFTFDPAQPYTTPQVPDMVCPEGTWLSSGNREMRSQGTEVKVPLQTPYQAPEWVPDQVEKFPDCYPATNVKCELKLIKVNVTPELDCHSLVAGSSNPCADWKTDPNRTERYECRFGSTKVALKRCTPYADLFSVEVVTPTPTDPDADVEVPPVVDPTPEETPNLGGCVPNWSTELLNPWWVFKAQACALKWAFVPETSLQTRVASVRDAFKTKVPFTWFAGFAAIPVAVPNDGCPDWRITIPSPGGDGNQLDKNVVCDSSYTDAIRTARPVFLVFMGALALWPLIRSTAYAAFPIIKPQPGVLR